MVGPPAAHRDRDLPCLLAASTCTAGGEDVQTAVTAAVPGAKGRPVAAARPRPQGRFAVRGMSGRSSHEGWEEQNLAKPPTGRECYRHHQMVRGRPLLVAGTGLSAYATVTGRGLVGRLLGLGVKPSRRHRGGPPCDGPAVWARVPAFWAIRAAATGPVAAVEAMRWSWWAWSPVKWTTLSATHGEKPAKATTSTPEMTWVTSSVTPEPAWPAPPTSMK